MDPVTICEECKENVEWTADGICVACIRQLRLQSKRMECGHTASATDGEGACIMCSVEECVREASERETIATHVAKKERGRANYNHNQLKALATNFQAEIDALKEDKARLDWLEQHSFAFVRDASTGKGFIRLSDAYLSHPGYGLRDGIDDAIEKGNAVEVRPRAEVRPRKGTHEEAQDT